MDSSSLSSSWSKIYSFMDDPRSGAPVSIDDPLGELGPVPDTYTTSSTLLAHEKFSPQYNYNNLFPERENNFGAAEVDGRQYPGNVSETGYVSDGSSDAEVQELSATWFRMVKSHSTDRHSDELSSSGNSSSSDGSRGHWKNRSEFLLSVLGYAVGLGNLWRFPYLAYENGGAAFLIPYLVIVVLVGRPLFMSEVSLGQYTQRGPLHTWKRCIPAMSGLGLTLFTSALMGSVIYTIVLAYAVYFVYDIVVNIGGPVPWAWCNPMWAGNDCYSVGSDVPCSMYNLTGPTDSVNCTSATVASSALYWSKVVLGMDPEGLTEPGDLGELHLHLVLSLLVIWVLVAFSTIKGIQSVGKVVYFTATFPFVVLLVLAIAGMTLPGAGMGLRYLFVPQWEKLLHIKVWRVATEQVLFSMSVAGSGLITFGSYNKFNAKIQMDIILLSVLDLVASLMSAVTIFSVLGAMAYELGIEDVSTVVASGPGLAFIAYPEAITRTMPLPHLWSLLFFLMVLTLGLDSMFAGMETICVTVTDTFPRLRRYKGLVAVTFCVSFFALGIVFCTAKAQYLFYLMDVYGAGIGGLLFCILKGITLFWIYGVRRFSADIEFMQGHMPSILLKISWAFIAPVTLIALFVGSVLMWTRPQYGGEVDYPPWGAALGWFFAFFALSFTPVVFIIQVIKACILKDPCSAFRPTPEWGPGCPKARARLERMQNRNFGY